MVSHFAARRPPGRAVAFGLALSLATLITWPSRELRAEHPPAPQMLPENTLVYARLADAQDAGAKFRETAMGRILEDPQMKPFVSDLWQSAKDAFQQASDELGVTLEQLVRIPQGEACIAIVGASEGPPALIAFLDVDDELPTAQKLIDRALREAENGGSLVSRETLDDQEITLIGGVGRRNREMALFIREGTIVITSDKQLAKQTLEIWRGNQEKDLRTLADNKKFTAIMSQSVGTKDERPQVTFFIDPIELVRNVGRGNLGAQTGLALLGPLGLDSLEAIGGSVILAAEEFESISHIHVLIKNPRQAVMKMLAMESGDLTPEPWVPKDVVSYMTVYWNFETTFTELADLYDVINLRQGAFADLVRTRISDEMGVDVEKELLPALSGRITMLSRVQRPVKLNSQTTAIAVQVKDGDAFHKVLDKIMAKFPDAMERSGFGSTTYYKIRGQQPPPNFDEELMRLPEPAFAVLGDYVIFSDSPKFIEQCIITQNSPDTSLANDLEYKLVASRIQRHTGGRAPGLIAFQRPEETLRAIYELATAESTKQRLADNASNPLFGALDRAMDKNPLPPFSVISQYLSPAGGIMINDETGFHYIAFSLKRE